MEQIINKNKALEKMKNASRIIAWLCIAAAVFYIALTAFTFRFVFGSGEDLATMAPAIGTLLQKAVQAVIMFIAAKFFFRTSSSGMPFTPENVRAIRIIGVMFIVNSAIPGAATFILGDSLAADVGEILFNSYGIVEGLLFLFIAQIMHYGSMLQQESDETL